MKGYYLIRWDDTELHHGKFYKRREYLQTWRKPWRAFVSLCREFKQIGLDYQVRITTDGNGYYLPAIELHVSGVQKEQGTFIAYGKQTAPFKKRDLKYPPNSEHDWHI